MILKDNIARKITAALIILFVAFLSTSLYAQGAAAPAPKTDMTEVYKTAFTYILLFLSICLFIAIVGKSIRFYELTKQIEGKGEGINWNKVHAILFAIFLVLGLYGVYWEYTVHGSMILPDAASVHGKKIDEMFNLTLIITTIVFVVTHILLFGFAYFYKYSSKRKAYYYPHNNTIEKIWTIAPALVLTVLVLMGFLTWRSIFFKPENPKNKALQIEVTSEQYAWNIRYAGNDGNVGARNYKLTTSDNPLGIDFKDIKSRDDLKTDELVIPVGKPVKLLLGSKDVIHSFYLPHFRVQLNCVPGLRTIFEFVPTKTTVQMKQETNDPNFEYLFYCAKICGGGHYNMQKKVKVVSMKEYKDWLAQQKPYLNDDLRKEFNLPVPAKSVTDSSKKDSVVLKGKQMAFNHR